MAIKIIKAEAYKEYRDLIEREVMVRDNVATRCRSLRKCSCGCFHPSRRKRPPNPTNRGEHKPAVLSCLPRNSRPSLYHLLRRCGTLWAATLM